MIRTLFIANRGEISLRIIRTAKRMGIATVLGVSEADRNALPALMADGIVVLGPAPSGQSYLDVDRVVGAAVKSGADAVHPGYGFLSENARFARAVRAEGMIFVGPSPESLDAVGDKLKARAVGAAAGLPIVPGGQAADLGKARKHASEIGYPLLIKAVSGGGGRGMKRVDREADLEAMVAMAMAEAQAAFGDPRVYIERYITRGRHVEVQVLGDGRRAIQLGTRDCSIQRRFQKLVEEAPAPDIPPAQHAALCLAAVRLAESLAYQGAGTVEFLVDAESFEFYFLEMNARIQVEHPVTEAITGVDLVEQQLLIADGQPMGIRQEDVTLNGHAIEVRINAEDWTRNFLPSPGRITTARWPAGPHIRVDSHIESGGVVPPYYDSLIGKLIVSGVDRTQAIARMSQALDTLILEGVATTAPMHRRIMADARFRAGAVDTRFFEGLADG
ncbi:MAG TPA: biotin carboxylase N-terminal domain-containing protein [Rhizomicrobium sp.]|jgi:acetyl-CoA carboxylase biotin carboxylase subunit|nr:biotin carboxylase N-terminal domain-containing protein [Rhizomicrobium sp.]